ncbi:MAG: hypothetical protein NDI61_07995 [Bdellovibrionaceae bacterium]|nr:hypothetical protein [Pseudobdellovibrionaceae bacterium]
MATSRGTNLRQFGMPRYPSLVAWNSALAVFLLAFIFGDRANAQMRGDPVSIQYVSYPHGNDAYELGLGAPPIPLGAISWINSLHGKRLRFLTDSSPSGEEVESASDYRYSSVFRTNLSEKTGLTVGGSISIRNLDEDLRISDETRFMSGFVSYSRSFGLNPKSRWSLGLVVPDRSSDISVLPSLGLEYENVRGTFQFRLSWPASLVSYAPTKGTRFGLMALYDAGSYALPSGARLRVGAAEYLRSERFVVAAFLRQRLLQSVYLSLRGGYMPYGETFIQDGDFEDLRSLGQDSGTYASVGLSLAFD